MAANTTQKQAARRFVQEWSGKGYEKGETQRFWISLLQNVFGVIDATKAIEFEIPVKTILKEKGSDFIDGYIKATKVLIEQKGSHVDLNAKSKQSDGAELTPYQQGRRYAAGLPLNMHPRWIVACNFTTFEVHDMERPNDAPEIIQLADLEKEYHRLSFLVDDTNVHLKKELEVSIQAGEIVGVLYDKILSQYNDPSDPDSQKALNKLCVRLVFCLYAEDAGIYGSKNMFHDYMSQFEAKDFRKALIELFKVLDTKPEDRDKYMDDDLAAFPYVNGGMFAGDIEIPRINEEIRSLILQRASDDFDWSLISPTIFGAVFESTLNPETRRAGGMHYTSIENIHKVIDPLFLDDLKAELADIKATSVAKTKRERAFAFQDKLAGLKFFDPACGSGNFLTESYTSLRRLENDALRIIYGDNRVIGEMAEPIKVSINQFYGIEINDFACSVAQTALWIAESQMMQETDEIVGFNLDPLPLKTYTNIHEGNALLMDWNDVIPASELNYIMGNPPFIGARMMAQGSKQKKEVETLFGQIKDVQDLDYVCCWFRKAAEMIQGTDVHVGLVATNSICQGSQVPILWDVLLNTFHVHIDYAYQTFKWESEASDKAAVHCVIVGFSTVPSTKKKQLFFADGTRQMIHNISPYLVDGPSVFAVSQKTPICDVPQMNFGNQPRDGGHFVFSDEGKKELENNDPKAAAWLRPYIGAVEFIQRKQRWCMWLRNASPGDIRSSKTLYEIVEAVKQFRLSSSAKTTIGYAKVPHLFAQITQPEGVDCLLIPRVSSENRYYAPIGFIPAGVVASDAVQIVPNASLYHFGVLTSSVHMAWMRVVCGRLKSDYRYSKEQVYNPFPWPSGKVNTEKIEKTAQGILDARAKYPESSFADLYDPVTMPYDLQKAHHANDIAVLEAFGFPKDATESDIVARLFKMYQELTK